MMCASEWFAQRDADQWEERKKMHTQPRMTDLGYFIGIHPIGSTWYCVAYDGLGRWQSSCECKSLKEAKVERRKWFKHHAKMARERFARAAARRTKRSG